MHKIIKFKNLINDNQVGREVKAPDLRSGSLMGSWVRTPHLVAVTKFLIIFTCLIICIVFQQHIVKFRSYAYS